MAKRLKTGGRKSGTPNKLSGHLREIVTEILSDELTELRNYISELDKKDRAAILIKLLPYGLSEMLPTIEVDGQTKWFADFGQTINPEPQIRSFTIHPASSKES